MCRFISLAEPRLSVKPKWWRCGRHRLTYVRIAKATGLSKATISRILKRYRLNRLSLLDPPPPVSRYEYDEPGACADLVGMEVLKEESMSLR